MFTAYMQKKISKTKISLAVLHPCPGKTSYKKNYLNKNVCFDFCFNLMYCILLFGYYERFYFLSNNSSTSIKSFERILGYINDFLNYCIGIVLLYCKVRILS